MPIKSPFSPLAGHRLAGVAALLVGVLGFNAGAAAVPLGSLNGVVVIGDSYADSGNVFALTGGSFPYPSGRFSNGPVWVEDLAGALGFAAKPVYGQFVLPPAVEDLHTNFATGGAQLGYGNTFDVPPAFGFGFPTGMSAQKDTLIGNLPALESAYGLAAGTLAGSVLPQSLFVVHAAGNDYRRWTDLNDLAELASVVADSIDSLSTIVTDLHTGAGAQYFLIPNMPGYFEADDPFVGTVDSARAFAEAFNAALAPTLADLRTNLGVDIVEVDFFGLFEDIVADPLAFGIANLGAPCVDFDALLQVQGICSNPESTLMWDSLHPTGATHALLADAALTALQPVPVPAAAWLFISGLLAAGGLGQLRKRD